MIINRVDLVGFRYQKINSDYFFKPGLNIIEGSNATGKSTIINSIVSGFSSETYQELWGGFLYHRLNQEPVITIEYQYQQVSYCLTKKVKKDGMECQIYVIDEEGGKSLLCEGTKAIEVAKQHSSQIIYLESDYFHRIYSRGDEYRNFFLGEFDHDNQSSSEFFSLVNELMLEYASGNWFLGIEIAVVDGHVVFRERKSGRQLNLGGGAKTQFTLMSLIALTKLREDSPILILDDWCVGMDYGMVPGIIQSIDGALDSQVIVSTFPMMLNDLEVEQHKIQLKK